MNKIFYVILKVILKPVYKFYYNPKIYNKDNLKVKGPLIIAGNHIHIMDQCNVIISTKRIINYMAKKEYFDNYKTKWFFKMVGCISVNRNTKDIKATEEAINILKNGGAIGIFPEGTRNKTKEKLLPFKYGTVSMAKKTNATIVPFAIRGEYKFRSKNLKVIFGKPFKIDNMQIEEANNKLYKTIDSILSKLDNSL